MPVDLVDTGILAFVTFFVAIDPIGLVPIFIALTQHAPAVQRRHAATKGTLVGAAILITFAICGEAALTRLGIGLPAFRTAGGITLLLLALEMIFERRSQRRTTTAEHVQQETMAEVAVFPLAIPLIAGPAAITAVILQTSRHEHDLLGQIVVGLALAAVLVVLYLLLRASDIISRWLSPTLIMVLSRLLGLLLAALAVQYILDGLREAFAA